MSSTARSGSGTSAAQAIASALILITFSRHVSPLEFPGDPNPEVVVLRSALCNIGGIKADPLNHRAAEHDRRMNELTVEQDLESQGTRVSRMAVHAARLMPIPQDPRPCPKQR